MELFSSVGNTILIEFGSANNQRVDITYIVDTVIEQKQESCCLSNVLSDKNNKNIFKISWDVDTGLVYVEKMDLDKSYVSRSFTF